MLHPRCRALIFLFSHLCNAANAQQSLSDTPAPKKSLPDTPKTKNVKTQTKAGWESGWPRTFISGADTFTIYQPQVDKWHENLIDLYCAVQLKAGKESAACARRYSMFLIVPRKFQIFHWLQARPG